MVSRNPAPNSLEPFSSFSRTQVNYALHYTLLLATENTQKSRHDDSKEKETPYLSLQPNRASTLHQRPNVSHRHLPILFAEKEN